MGIAEVSGEPFFLVDQLPAAGPFRLTGPEGRHAATVRRMRAGEPVVLTDGRGSRAWATVTATGKAEVDLEVGPPELEPVPAVRVTVIQALPKGERGELAVDLATEAGVDAIVPWAARRCVTRWTDDRAAKGVARWTATAREAAKQSRRSRVPVVYPVATTAQVATLIRATDRALVLHESATAGLAAGGVPREGELALIVGPEGGIDDQELAVFTEAGARVVRLGPQVLRTSTAAAVALGALGVLTDRWAG